MNTAGVLAATFAVLAATSPAVAQDAPPADVTQTIQVTAAEAERFYDAMQKQSKKNIKKDGIEIKLRWKVDGKVKDSASSWFIKGHLIGASKVTKHSSDLGWVASVLSPSNQSVEFDYDKACLFRYSGTSQKLTVTMEEGAQVTGKYNVVIDSKGSAKVDVSATPTINLSSPNFSVSATADSEKYSVAVNGLPYILSPEVLLDRVDGFLRMRLGVAWQSVCDLNAVPVQGDESKVSFDLSFGGKSVVKGDAGVSSSTFKSSMNLSAVGKGLVGRIIYDETETKLDYELNFEADASWSIQVDGYPMMQVGSAHFEETKNIKPGFLRKKPPVLAEGIDDSAAPAPAALALPAAPNNNADARISQLGVLYVQPKPASATAGLNGTLSKP